MAELISSLLALVLTLWIVGAVLRASGLWFPDFFKQGKGKDAATAGNLGAVLFAPLAAVAKWALKAAAGRGGEGARFMGFFERSSILSPSNKGFVVDGVSKRLSADDSFRNLAVVATTGAGKTAGFILPNILRLDGCSMVIADPSGSLFQRTSGDLEARGYEVRVINPSDPSSSDLYNPIARARTHTEIAEVAHVLVRTANPGAGKPGADSFWTDGAEEIIRTLVRVLKRYPDPACHNLANLHYLLNSFGDGTGLQRFVADYADDETCHAFKGFVSQSANTMQGHLSTAKTALKMLADPDVARLTAGESFDFAELRERKTALFLVFPQNKVSYYSFLMNLLYSQLFHFCLDDSSLSPESLPIYFLLDEFGHATVPEFDAIVTTTRQRRIAIAIVLQAISQLETRYGRAAAETILNGGVASRLFFSGMDIGTAQMLERTVGTRRREVRDSEDRLHLKDDALITAAGLRTMPDNKVLYLFANKAPAILKVTPYYEQSDLVRRTKAPPAKVGPFDDERIRYVDIG